MFMRTAILFVILGTSWGAFGADAPDAPEAWIVCDPATAAGLSGEDRFRYWQRHVVAEPGIAGLVRAAREVLLRPNVVQLAVVIGPSTPMLKKDEPTSMLGRLPIPRWLSAESRLDSATALDGAAGLRGRAALMGSRLVVLVVGPRTGVELEVLSALLESYPETAHWLMEETSWLGDAHEVLLRLDKTPLREPSFRGLRRFLRLSENQALRLRHDFEEGVMTAGGLDALWGETEHWGLDAAVRGVLSERQQPRWDRIPAAVRVRLAERIYRETNPPEPPSVTTGGALSALALAARLHLDAEESARFEAVLAQMQEDFIALMDTAAADGGASPLARLVEQLQAEGPEGLGDDMMQALMDQPYTGGDGESYGAAAGRIQREALGALRDVLSHEALAEFESMGLENLFEIDTDAMTLEEALADRVASLDAANTLAATQETAFWQELGWTAAQWEEARKVLDELKERTTAIVREMPMDDGLAPIAVLGEKLRAGAPDAIPAFVAYLGEAKRAAGETYAEAMAREEARAQQALGAIIGDEGLAQLRARFPGSLSEVPTGTDPFDAALQEYLR